MNEQLYQDGLAPDIRTEEQKAKDYSHSDLAGAIILNWKEKTQNEWKHYTSREQNGSSSCVGQSAAKALETFLNEVESAHPIYRSRNNFPATGMWLQDLGRILKNIGTTTEALDISQWQNEQTMNRDITVPTPIKVAGYFFPNPKIIDEIAEAIEQSGHCILIFHANRAEWTSKPLFNGAISDFGHAICAIDYFMQGSEKCLLIEDSTGHFSSLDKEGHRIITETYLKSRCDGAMYIIKNLPTKFIFTKTLRFGSPYHFDVKMLQTRLGITVDGYWGNKTDLAFRKWQKDNGLVVDGICGIKSREKLNA